MSALFSPYCIPLGFDAKALSSGSYYGYTKVTVSIKVNSTVIFKRHNKAKGLKHHIVLYSELVKILKFYVNYCRCAINANHM